MKFKEQFPSFPDMENVQEFINYNDNERGYCLDKIKEKIQEHCLDKQFVRNIIER